MDPNANLAEQVAIARALILEDGVGDDKERLTEWARAERLAELVVALNAWLSHGGALPRAWEVTR